MISTLTLLFLGVECISVAAMYAQAVFTPGGLRVATRRPVWHVSVLTAAGALIGVGSCGVAAGQMLPFAVVNVALGGVMAGLGVGAIAASRPERMRRSE